MLFSSWMLSLRSWSRNQSRRTAASRRSANRRERLGHQIAAVVERLENRWLLSTVSWDGGGNGTNWSDPLNWSGNVLPGAADDVTINFGSATVQHDMGTGTVVRQDGGNTDSDICGMFEMWHSVSNSWKMRVRFVRH